MPAAVDVPGLGLLRQKLLAQDSFHSCYLNMHLFFIYSIHQILFFIKFISRGINLVIQLKNILLVK